MPPFLLPHLYSHKVLLSLLPASHLPACLLTRDSRTIESRVLPRTHRSSHPSVLPHAVSLAGDDLSLHVCRTSSINLSSLCSHATFSRKLSLTARSRLGCSFPGSHCLLPLTLPQQLPYSWEDRTSPFWDLPRKHFSTAIVHFSLQPACLWPCGMSLVSSLESDSEM